MPRVREQPALQASAKLAPKCLIADAVPDPQKHRVARHPVVEGVMTGIGQGLSQKRPNTGEIHHALPPPPAEGPSVK